MVMWMLRFSVDVDVSCVRFTKYTALILLYILAYLSIVEVDLPIGYQFKLELNFKINTDYVIF